jgi:hypothetical protein
MEEDETKTGASATQAPTSDPTTGSGIPGVAGTARADDNQPPQEGKDKKPKDAPGLADADLTKSKQEDPEEPEQDEDEDEKEFDDFESWRGEYMKMAIASDTEEMLNAIRPWKKNQAELESTQAKFINDNYNILVYREDATIAKVSEEIRSLIKKSIDKTHPGTVIMQHITSVLEKTPTLQQVLIKLYNAYGLKGELHRKFIAAILGAVQTGGANIRQDLVYCEKKMTINIDTRYVTEFGEISVGRWSLKTTDPENILSESEMDRLQDGAPEERMALRRRIVIESMARHFMKRSLLIHVGRPDGNVISIGWDLGESLLASYVDGKLVVRSNESPVKNAMISQSGDIIPLLNVDVLYVKETGETDDSGNPEAVEVPFLSVRDGNVFLVADKSLLEIASATMNGMFIKSIPFTGNPSDLQGIRDSLPTLKGILGKDY